jgi:SAM-dependent methyltransferase
MIILSSLRQKLRVLARLIDQGENPVRFTKYIPGKSRGVDLKLNMEARQPGEPLPVPPRALHLGYGSDDETYVASGQEDISKMIGAIAAAAPGFKLGERPILDLGCGAGRMIRHLASYAEATEVWGMDVSAPHINWLKTHLSPPFGFAVNTTLPHIPFADGFFSLIYCGSVFTHIDDMAESWFLETRRALCRGGILFCTIHDEHTLAILKRDSRHGLARVVANHPSLASTNPADIVVIGNDMDSNVFYTGNYLKTFLEKSFNILARVPGAYGYQTALILQKR